VVSSPDSRSPDLAGLAGDRASPIHRLDPRAKIVAFTVVTVIAVSVPLSAWPVWVACAAVLAAAAAVAGVGPGEIWRRARFLLPLVLAVAVVVPLVRDGGASWQLGPLVVHEAGLGVFAAVAAKTTIGLASAILLTSTTGFAAIVSGLDAMRAPRLLTLIAGLMYRYLFVIGDEVRRMRQALAARAYRPRSLLGAGALGRLVAALFLRSYSRGERVHVAMLARGYSGRMPQLEPLALERADVVFATSIVAGLLALRVAVAL
jgi:cobalt/nickel transport system permease protein